MQKKLLLGLDIGSSSVKASIIDVKSGSLVNSATSPKTEMKINAEKPNWAEQHPDIWWENCVAAVHELIDSQKNVDYKIVGIGISYQMHGLVMIDKNQNVLAPSIIWCDSRAVETGNKAFKELGEEFCLENYLNSPGNFTASKLKWVKENNPELYNKIYKIMLPGDFIAMKLSGRIATTRSGLSEGILWNFNKDDIAFELLEHLGIDKELLPEIVNTFGDQGSVSASASKELGIEEGIKIGFRAGDQPSNALALNVLNPGEIAATGGTSGVVYGVTADNLFDTKQRVNAFAHVNYSDSIKNKGVLLCINGTGRLNSWLRNEIFGENISYDEMNKLASQSVVGANGVIALPFGNGAERSLGNKETGTEFINIKLNTHTRSDIIRAAQEGIAFAFNYGVEVMKEMGMQIEVMRAGFANMFLSEIFQEAIANTCNVKVELYNTDNSQGVARGAGIGLGIYASPHKAFDGLKVIKSIEPNTKKVEEYSKAYSNWRKVLENKLK